MVFCFFNTDVFSLLDMKNSVNFLLIFTKLFLDFLTYINWSNFSKEWNMLFRILFSWIFKNEIKRKKLYLVNFWFCCHYFLNVYIYIKNRQEKTLTGEMQRKNSLFGNPKLVYFRWTCSKIWLLVFHKMRGFFSFLFIYFFAWQKSERVIVILGALLLRGSSIVVKDKASSNDWVIWNSYFYYNFLQILKMAASINI